jgi:hypothetical protein
MAAGRSHLPGGWLRTTPHYWWGVAQFMLSHWVRSLTRARGRWYATFLLVAGAAMLARRWHRKNKLLPVRRRRDQTPPAAAAVHDITTTTQHTEHTSRPTPQQASTRVANASAGRADGPDRPAEETGPRIGTLIPRSRTMAMATSPPRRGGGEEGEEGGGAASGQPVASTPNKERFDRFYTPPSTPVRPQQQQGIDGGDDDDDDDDDDGQVVFATPAGRAPPVRSSMTTGGAAPAAVSSVATQLRWAAEPQQRPRPDSEPTLSKVEPEPEPTLPKLENKRQQQQPAAAATGVGGSAAAGHASGATTVVEGGGGAGWEWEAACRGVGGFAQPSEAQRNAAGSKLVGKRIFVQGYGAGKVRNTLEASRSSGGSPAGVHRTPHDLARPGLTDL